MQIHSLYFSRIFRLLVDARIVMLRTELNKGRLPVSIKTTLGALAMANGRRARSAAEDVAILHRLDRLKAWRLGYVLT
jgi:hypothetical protein